MIAIDTSVLLAIFKGEAEGAAWLSTLAVAAQSESLAATPVVIAEIRAFFGSDQECTEALSTIRIVRSELTLESALLAGSIFRLYRRQGGPRTTILADFIVAAHAAKQATALATLDRGFTRTYFPKLALLAPLPGRLDSKPGSDS